jgi:hypothetical protein
MKKARYRIKSLCGLLNKGDIIDCYILADEGDKAIVYLPRRNRDECGCIVLCKYIKNRNVFEELNEESYVNIVGYMKEFGILLKTMDKDSRKKKII